LVVSVPASPVGEVRNRLVLKVVCCNRLVAQLAFGARLPVTEE